MILAKPQRHRSPAHLRWVATIPCIVCAMGRCDPDTEAGGDVVSQVHHLTHAQPKARGLKAGDQWVVPLCRRHHDPNSFKSVHAHGNERDWWTVLHIDPIAAAEALWAASVAAGRVREGGKA